MNRPKVTRATKMTGVGKDDESAGPSILSSTLTSRTPPPGSPASSERDGRVQIPISLGGNQASGSNVAHERDLMANTIRELQEEIAQLRSQVGQLDAKIEERVTTEEIYERVTEHRIEMRDWCRKFEERMERQEKAQADLRKQVEKCLEQLRKPTTVQMPVEDHGLRGTTHHHNDQTQINQSNPNTTGHSGYENDGCW